MKKLLVWGILLTTLGVLTSAQTVYLLKRVNETRQRIDYYLNASERVYQDSIRVEENDSKRSAELLQEAFDRADYAEQDLDHLVEQKRGMGVFAAASSALVVAGVTMLLIRRRRAAATEQARHDIPVAPVSD
ncbi:hypothetical protein SUDANB105_07851 [Streptomyces sp. enrichment culture]|uniref:hypothetical protein n=1 Tax=Streptomyces sp. enrichment culture TaxID=1795815 RepID=UPI003F55E306